MALIYSGTEYATKRRVSNGAVTKNKLVEKSNDIMQRRRTGRQGKKTRTRDGHALSSERAVRFYWSGRYCAGERGVRCLSIGCAPQHANLTQVETELTLAALISSWLHWLYIRSGEQENDGLC
jgi:hypothetical protein